MYLCVLVQLGLCIIIFNLFFYIFYFKKGYYVPSLSACNRQCVICRSTSNYDTFPNEQLQLQAWFDVVITMITMHCGCSLAA